MLATAEERERVAAIPWAERCPHCGGYGWTVPWHEYGLRYVKPTKRERAACPACAGSGRVQGDDPA